MLREKYQIKRQLKPNIDIYNMNTIREQIGIFRFAPWLKVIVITGGPCGGKSTFLRMAIALLKKHGIMTIVVPEVARELIAAGFHPALLPWKHSNSFQELVFKTILEKEARYFETFAQIHHGDQPVVFLCDRGLMDGRAYMDEKSFKILLQKFGVSHAEVLDRYTGVVSLTSAADGAPAFYTTDDERQESLEEARVLDEKTTHAWLLHQHLSVVDNSTDFPTKINRALLALHRLLNMPIPQEIEKRYRVDQFSFDQIPPGAQPFEIKQIYLLRPDRPEIECRVRCKTTEGHPSYYYTEKTLTKVEGVRGELDDPITETQYNELITLYADPACLPVYKTRYKIKEGSHILEIDVYHKKLSGLVKIEVEFPSEAAMNGFTPPRGFTLTDVTSDKRYSNRMLAEFGLPTL